MFQKVWQLLALATLLAAVALTLPGCGQNGLSRGSTAVGERYFVEGHLEIADAEARHEMGYPIQFAVVIGHEYTLRYTAEKWMGHEDSEMDMRIDLPSQLHLVGGQTAGSGQSKRMMLEVQVIPTEVGETEVTAKATNLGNNMWCPNTITVHITETVAEAKQFFDKPAKKHIKEIEVIKDANE